MKKKKIIIISIFIIIFICAEIFSIVKFTVFNSFSACIGMLKILFTDTEYVIVQEWPCRVGFSKTQNNEDILNKYMESVGFKQLQDERMRFYICL